MSRPTAEPTDTLSICVTDAERAAVRDAAHAASLSVSAWSATRIASAIAHPAARARLAEVVKRASRVTVPRGARKARVSAVMRSDAHELLTACATKLGTTAHAVAQAVILDAAAMEPANGPARVAAPAPAPATTKARATAAAETTITLPADLAGVDPAALAEMVSSLAAATATAILDGKGRMIAEGVRGVALKYKGAKMGRVRVAVPEIEFVAPAHVLDVPAGDYAMAMGIKAARVLMA